MNGAFNGHGINADAPINGEGGDSVMLVPAGFTDELFSPIGVFLSLSFYTEGFIDELFGKITTINPLALEQAQRFCSFHDTSYFYSYAPELSFLAVVPEDPPPFVSCYAPRTFTSTIPAECLTQTSFDSLVPQRLYQSSESYNTLGEC